MEGADVFIRLADYFGQRGFNLDDSVTEKLRYNGIRADHDPANRNQDGGKKF